MQKKRIFRNETDNTESIIPMKKPKVAVAASIASNDNSELEPQDISSEEASEDDDTCETKQSQESHMSLPIPSPEQQAILNCVEKGDSNILIRALAGTSKSTTCYLIHKYFPHLHILGVTYTSNLKRKARQDLIDYNLSPSQFEINSLNSFAQEWYAVSWKDKGIIQVIDDDLPLIESKQALLKTKPFDLFITDEAQDLNKDLARFADKVIRDLRQFNSQMRCIFLGDEHQQIYDFKESDSRYLTLSATNQLWPLNNFPWTEFTLSTSFRLTPENCDMVNYLFLEQDGSPSSMARLMQSGKQKKINHENRDESTDDAAPTPKEDDRPVYFIYDPNRFSIVDEIKRLLEVHPEYG
jgi:hypothetical protein